MLCLVSVKEQAQAQLSRAIPPQPLAAVLTQFSQQTGLQLVYVSDAIKNQKSKGARAGLSNADALTALLDGTGLTYEFLNERAVRIFSLAPHLRKPASRRDGDDAPDTPSLESVVVTASPFTVKKLYASYSVVVADLEQIKRSNPKSSADILKIAPGVWTESTGGQTGANIEVAGFPGNGDSPFFTLQMDGSPLYGAPSPIFFAQTTAFRIDDTIERIEIVQGGPSVVFADGQMGATANVILKRGTEQPTGSVGFTYGSEQLERLDAFSGFKIATGWLGSVGGFFRTSKGVRDPRDYPADVGGQLTATLSHEWANGSLLMYARALDDKNQFISDLPLLQTGSGHFSAYPGIDPLTTTYGSNAIRYVSLPNASGGVTRADLANGRGANMYFLGGDLKWRMGDWTVADRWLMNAGDTNVNALFSTPALPATLADEFSADPAPGGYAIPPGARVRATYVGGGAVDPNQSVISMGWWFVHRYQFNISNELQLSRQLFEHNTLTGGLYLSHYDQAGTYLIGNQMLMSNTPNARPISISYVSDGVTYRRTDPQGFIDFSGNFDAADHGTATNLAFYLVDSWRLNRWLFDAGLRIAEENLTEHLCNVSPLDLDGDPTNLYNKGVPSCDGTFATTDYNPTRVSWTAGVSRELRSNLSVYGRADHGVHFLSFSDVWFDNTGQTPPEQTIEGYEIGLKYQSPWIYADLSAYRRIFSGVPYFPTDSQGAALSGTTLTFGDDSKGVNAIMVLTPVDRLNLQLVGSYLDGRYSHFNGCIAYVNPTTGPECGAIDGRPLQRQPVWHVALTPGYSLPLRWGELTAFMTYTYVGKHWEDVSGLQPLGTFSTLDFGLIGAVGANWELRVQGTNVTNELGLTEGTPIAGAPQTGTSVIYGRPLEGREINFGIKYKF